MTRRTGITALSRAAAAVIGALIAVLIWGRATPEQRALRDRVEDYHSLPPASQARIRPAWQDLQNQSPDRQAEIRRIHQAVRNDPELARTMTQFTDWWTSLNPFEADELRSLPRDEMPAAISARYRSDRAAEQKLRVEFDAWWHFARFNWDSRRKDGNREDGDDRSLAVPDLILTTAEYSRLLEPVATSAPVNELRTGSDEPLSLTDPDHQLLSTCLSIMDAFLTPREATPKRAILDTIHERLLTEVPDAAWRAEYLDRTEDSRFGRWHRTFTPLILVRTLVGKLGHRLKGSMALDDDTLIREFASIADQGERKDLMQLRPERALERLEQRVFAAGQGGDSPERRLMQRYLETESRLGRFFRSSEARMLLPGSNSGPGGPGRRPPERPSRRDDPRPPR